MIVELLLILVFLVSLLYLVHQHLTSQRDAFFSLTRQYLTTLESLIPNQTREVAAAIVSVVNPYPPTPQQDAQPVSLSKVYDDLEPEEPFLPPWEVEVAPESVPKTGEWR